MTAVSKTTPSAPLARQVRLFRFWLFRPLMTLAMWVLPPSRYKAEMNAVHWTIGLRVQAHWAASEASRTGATDVI